MQPFAKSACFYKAMLRLRKLCGSWLKPLLDKGLRNNSKRLTCKNILRDSQNCCTFKALKYNHSSSYKDFEI